VLPFLRHAATKLYEMPPSQVYGTSKRSKCIVENGKGKLVRTYRMDYFDNWDAKLRLINRVIGMKPIFVASNSNGDQPKIEKTVKSFK
jgi:hypothetical protein